MMADSVIGQVLEAVIEMAQDTNPYANITIGPLPPNNGITMTISGGWPDSTFLTKGMAYELGLVLNGKHSNAQTVCDALNNIHQALTQTKTYPRTDTYQITNIETTSSPAYLGVEPNKQILYGSGLRVKFFYKNKEDEQ